MTIPMNLLHCSPSNVLVDPHAVVEEPEHAHSVVDVSPVTILPEAWEEIVEGLEPVLQGLIHLLDEVLPTRLHTYDAPVEAIWMPF